MTDVFNKILSLDLGEKYYFQRPSSEWVVAGLPNLEINIMRIRGVPIGAGIQLPNHVMTRDEHHRRDSNDNLCFFRCLALHFGATTHALEGPTHRVKERVEEYAGKPFEDGVEVNMLPIIEGYFHISINVYSLDENKTAKII